MFLAARIEFHSRKWSNRHINKCSSFWNFYLILPSCASRMSTSFALIPSQLCMVPSTQFCCYQSKFLYIFVEYHSIWKLLESCQVILYPLFWIKLVLHLQRMICLLDPKGNLGINITNKRSKTLTLYCNAFNVADLTLFFWQIEWITGSWGYYAQCF